MRYGKRYGFELRLRCVKLRLEEGLPVSLLSKEVGASKDTVLHWVKAYRERGEAGLRNEGSRWGRRRKLSGPVRKKIKAPWIVIPLANPGSGPGFARMTNSIEFRLLARSSKMEGVKVINHLSLRLRVGLPLNPHLISRHTAFFCFSFSIPSSHNFPLICPIFFRILFPAFP